MQFNPFVTRLCCFNKAVVETMKEAEMINNS